MIVANRERDLFNRQRFVLYGKETLFVAAEYGVTTGLCA